MDISVSTESTNSFFIIDDETDSCSIEKGELYYDDLYDDITDSPLLKLRRETFDVSHAYTNKQSTNVEHMITEGELKVMKYDPAMRLSHKAIGARHDDFSTD